MLLSAGWGENLEDMQLSALRAALAQLALQKTRSLEICRLAKGELQGGVMWYSRLFQPNSPPNYSLQRSYLQAFVLFLE